MGVLIKNKVNYSGGKLLMSPECYSLEEKEIGCWTDGKPLYEKTFHATSGPTNNYNELDLGIASDSISMIKIKSCFIRNTVNGIDGVYHLGPYTNPADQQFLGGLTPKNNGNCFLFYRVGPYCAGGDLTLTVQYTKAIDTPGSGTWTPHGLSTVHYDNNEKIIGTWFGETLYEKSYQLTGIKGDNVVVDATLTPSTIRPIHIYSSFYITGGAYQGVSFAHELTTGQFIRVGVSPSQGLFCDIDGYNTGYFGTDGTNVYITIQYIKITTP